MKKIYRIEMQSRTGFDVVFVFWIGPNLDLVSTLDKAVPCTFEEHILVMERIGIPATAFEEK